MERTRRRHSSIRGYYPSLIHYRIYIYISILWVLFFFHNVTVILCNLYIHSHHHIYILYIIYARYTAATLYRSRRFWRSTERYSIRRVQQRVWRHIITAWSGMVPCKKVSCFCLLTNVIIMICSLDSFIVLFYYYYYYSFPLNTPFHISELCQLDQFLILTNGAQSLWQPGGVWISYHVI